MNDIGKMSTSELIKMRASINNEITERKTKVPKELVKKLNKEYKELTCKTINKTYTIKINIPIYIQVDSNGYDVDANTDEYLDDLESKLGNCIEKDRTLDNVGDIMVKKLKEFSKKVNKLSKEYNVEIWEMFDY